MKRKKAIFFLLVLLSYVPVLAQVDTAWVRRYDGPGNVYDEPHALTVDDSGNAYVTGQSFGSGSSFDYVTIKYAPNGETLWVRRYNGPANESDGARALGIDKNTNVYVTGTSGGLTYLSYDFVTIKYTPEGETLWVRRYNGSANGSDIPSALAIDEMGNVYATGCRDCFTPSSDFLTIKYAPNGDTLWARSYNGIGNDRDRVIALALDDSGNVYVTGESFIGSSSDCVTIKYAPNGDSLWVSRYHLLWQFLALVIDDSGNAYVAGRNTDGISENYATIKYNPNGETLWVRTYNGSYNGTDRAIALAVDDTGNVYVTGYTQIGVSKYDYATIKYASNGDLLWVRLYNGNSNLDDYANDIALDRDGNIYVTGSTDGIYTTYDYTTIKYNSAGDLLWAHYYNGLGGREDNAYSIAIDNSNNLYVTGGSVGSDGYSDIVTVKYVQFTCVDTAGDANGDGKINLVDIIYKVNYVFKGGTSPSPFCRGDDNADTKIDLQDIIYEVNYVFKGGLAPQKSRECCL